VLTDTSTASKEWPVPARFGAVMPDDWSKRGEAEYPEEWETAKGWLRRFPLYLMSSPDPDMIGHGLVLSGPAGTGKTMMACTFLNYLLRVRGFSVCFARDSDLAKILGNNYPTDDVMDRLWLLERCACLVVDDALRMGGRTELLEPFLRTRQDEGKPTIITINNTVAVSEVMASFMASFTNIELAGADRRRHPLDPDARW
jgi:hypothetical protein